MSASGGTREEGGRCGGKGSGMVCMHGYAKSVAVLGSFSGRECGGVEGVCVCKA